MRLLFIGSSKFGLRCLDGVLNLEGIQTVGVLSGRESFSISYNKDGVRNALYTDFEPFVTSRQIPFRLLSGKMSDPSLVQWIKELSPTFILVAGWYHMIPRVILDIAPTAGLHASLLPDYSGGAPLVWAMINGETRTGISLFLMDSGVDSGPLLGQAEEPILFEDTIATLYARIEEAGLGLIRTHLPKVMRGTAQYTIQDNSLRRIMPQRSPADGHIDWNWSARRIYDFIRAQTKPYPGAFTWLQNEPLKIWQAELLEEQEPGEPGALASPPKGEWRVTCGDGRSVRLRVVEWQGHEGEAGQVLGSKISGVNLRLPDRA